MNFSIKVRVGRPRVLLAMVAFWHSGIGMSAIRGDEPDLHCGSYCLYVSLKALDVPVPAFEQFQRELGEPSHAGFSLGQLAEIAERQGAKTRGVRTNLQNLLRRPERFSCIAKIDQAHFVLVGAVGDDEVWIVDPPREYSIPKDTFRTQWDGTALLISPGPLLAEEDLPSPWEAWWWVGGLGVVAVVVGGVVIWSKARR